MLADRVGPAARDDVARRCLSGGNCMMVCPTCSCTTVVDTTDLDGSLAQRDLPAVNAGDRRTGAPGSLIPGR